MIKRITYSNQTIYTTSGGTAGTLDGEYEATPNPGQQPGWYSLRKIVNGNVEGEIVANVHLIVLST